MLIDLLILLVGVFMSNFWKPIKNPFLFNLHRHIRNELQGNFAL